MDERPHDARIEHLKGRLQEDLVDDDGNAADSAEVDRVVEAAAEGLADAPIQEFTPLLIEHQARDELREQGLHRDLTDETDEGAVTTTDGEGESGGPRLSAQQGMSISEID
jgi:hypothetical protein